MTDPTAPPSPPPAGTSAQNDYDRLFADLFGAIDRLGVRRVPRSDAWVGGVCGGLSRRFGIDPAVIRVGVIVLTMISGAGLVAYALAWLLLPAPDGPGIIEAESDTSTGRIVTGSVLAVGGLLLQSVPDPAALLPADAFELWKDPHYETIAIASHYLDLAGKLLKAGENYFAYEATKRGLAIMEERVPAACHWQVGVRLQIVGESLCEAVDVVSTDTVLDVAAGNGNASLAAARRFADVTSTDYVPALLEEGRRRAEADGLPMTFRVADAERLPFAAASFDVVLSTFGVMFAPDQDRAAAELLMTEEPGFRISSWRAKNSFIRDRRFDVVEKWLRRVGVPE